jgi:hypothetical protein
VARIISLFYVVVIVLSEDPLADPSNQVPSLQNLVFQNIVECPYAVFFIFSLVIWLLRTGQKSYLEAFLFFIECRGCQAFTNLSISSQMQLFYSGWVFLKRHVVD